MLKSGSILVIFLNKLSLTDEGRIVQSCYPLFVRGRQVTEKQCDTHQFSMASLSNPDPKKMYILGHLPSEIQEQVYEHYDQTYRNQGSEVGELSEDALVRYNPETKQWTLVEIKQAGAGVGVGVLAGTLGFLLMALAAKSGSLGGWAVAISGVCVMYTLLLPGPGVGLSIGCIAISTVMLALSALLQ